MFKLLRKMIYFINETKPDHVEINEWEDDFRIEFTYKKPKQKNKK